MARELQFFADLEVTDITDPEVQGVLAELEERLDRSAGLAEVVIDGRRIHVGAGYRENNPGYTAWLLQAVSSLVKHSPQPSIECLLCDSTGDWWSERVFPAA